MPVERTRATLRFWHPTAAPQAVTDALGLRPTDHHVVGEERSTRSPQATAWPASHWSLASRLPEQSCLGDHLKHLLSLLDGKGEAVRQLVHDGWEGDWFCFVDHDGQAGLELPSTLLRDLAEVPLSLTLDLYGDDG